MSSTLTASAMNELADFFKLDRRQIAEVYREYRLGSKAEEIAEARGHDDPRKVEDFLGALRILFGRQVLPKKGGGRQIAVNEAFHWLNSDAELSEELQDHLNHILILAKRTNMRTRDYQAPDPVKHREGPRKRRPNGADGRQAGVYVITRQAYVDEREGQENVLLKIGYSDSVWERIDSARTWFPEPLVILRVFLVDDPKPMEMKFHVVLDALQQQYQAGGGIEWFDTSLELIDAIAASQGLRDCSKDIEPVEG